MTRALAIPEPTTLDYPVARVCDRIELWASDSNDVDALSDTNRKLAAIDTYLDRTSTAGRARIAATMRRLEVRIGQVLGKAKPGPRESSLANEDSLSANERHAFRQMAEHADVVEDVIAESSDEAPASRREVLRAIRGDADRGKASADELREQVMLGALRILIMLPGVIDKAIGYSRPSNVSEWETAIAHGHSSLDLLTEWIEEGRRIRRVK